MRVWLAWAAGAAGALIAAIVIGRVAGGFGPFEAGLLVLIGVISGIAARAMVRGKHVTVGLACVGWTLLGIVVARSLIAHDTARDLADELTDETNVVFDQLAAERAFPVHLQAEIDAAGGVHAVPDELYDRAWLYVRDELGAMPPEARRQRVALGAVYMRDGRDTVYDDRGNRDAGLERIVSRSARLCMGWCGLDDPVQHRVVRPARGAAGLGPGVLDRHRPSRRPFDLRRDRRSAITRPPEAVFLADARPQKERSPWKPR